MVGIGKIGRNPLKLVEITLSSKYASATLVRRLKTELERAGTPAGTDQREQLARISISVVDHCRPLR